MIDETAAHLAMRTRARSLVVCTTGSMQLAAVADGFTRADAGSFLTDGFLPGMEIAGSGFSSENNAAHVIKEVVTGKITTTTACTVQGSSAARRLTVGLPSKRAWENKKFTPTAGVPYVSDQFVPATQRSVGSPVAISHVEETGLYFITIHGLAGLGFAAIRREMVELKKLFTPATTFAAGSDSLSVRGDVGPYAGQIIPLDNGFATCQLTVPWRAYSRNVVAP